MSYSYCSAHPDHCNSGSRPRVVVLCGSTRFETRFRELAATLTLAGYIVVKPDVFMNDGHAEKAHLPAVTPADKATLDELHKRKIDLADEVLVLNVGGYIGESTRGEVEYAQKLGRPIRYLEPLTVAADEGSKA